jgi:hypothetical protein
MLAGQRPTLVDADIKAKVATYKEFSTFAWTTFTVDRDSGFIVFSNAHGKRRFCCLYCDIWDKTESPCAGKIRHKHMRQVCAKCKKEVFVQNTRKRKIRVLCFCDQSSPRPTGTNLPAEPDACHEKWKPDWKIPAGQGEFVTAGGWLVITRVYLSREGGFGVGGGCHVFAKLAGVQVEALAFWKTARRARSGSVTELKHEYQFYTKYRLACSPKFYGIAEVPPAAMDKAACAYALVLERLIPFEDYFGTGSRAVHGFVKRGGSVRLRQFVRGLILAVKDCHGAGVTHGDLKVGNILIREHAPSGPEFTERKSSKVRVYEAVSRKSDVVLGDWGSWRKQKKGARTGGTQYYRPKEWWGDAERGGTDAGATDRFAVVMVVLCTLAGTRLGFDGSDKTHALAFGKEYLRTLHTVWVQWWFSDEALQTLKRSGWRRGLRFVTLLRTRAANCRELHGALDQYLTSGAVGQALEVLDATELWTKFTVT